MTIAVSTPLRPLRISPEAELVPAGRFAEWHQQTSAISGLTELDREILDVIAGRYRQIQTQGSAGRLRIKWMAAT
jgi:hypothetical protein